MKRIRFLELVRAAGGRFLVAAVMLLCVNSPVRAQSSIEAYQETVKRQPTSDIAHYCLANAFLKAGQVQPALSEYERAYALSRSEQIRTFCRQILHQYGHDVAGNRSAAGMQVRAPWLSAPTTDGLERFHSEARNGRQRTSSTDSNQEGVILYSDPMGAEFDSWIAEFRMRFGTVLERVLRSRGFRSMAGDTRLVFSVDKQHRLRSHVVDSTMAPSMTDCFLATTRALDGSAALDFPPNTSSNGVNFAMAWSFPGRAARVAGTLSTRNVGAQINPQGVSARAGIMEYNTANGSLQSKDANGQLIGKQGVAQLKGSRAGASGALSQGSVTFSTDVSALLMPKPKRVELKAKPALKLDSGSANR